MRIITAFILILISLKLSAQYIPSGQIPVCVTKLHLPKKALNRSPIYLLGLTSATDNLGGVFYYDSTSVNTDDAMNTLAVVGVSLGRWVRANQKVFTYPTGKLHILGGGLKLFWTTGVTNSSGEVSINLTQEGTTTGTALFSTIAIPVAMSTVSGSAVGDTNYGTPDWSASPNVMKFRFVKPVLSVLSAITVASVPASTTVNIMIFGI